MGIDLVNRLESDLGVIVREGERASDHAASFAD